MSKNRIIPQMFDVRPVDETGDLDWQKIQAIGSEVFCVGDEPGGIERPSFEQFEKSANAYILGEAIEAKKAPVFHDPDFYISKEVEKASREAEIIEERMRFERERENQRLMLLQQQNEIFRRQEEKRLLEKQLLLAQQKAREEALQAEKERREQERERIAREQAMRHQKELQRIAEYNRRYNEAYEAAVIAERKKREQEEAEWLAAELKEEQERQAREKQNAMQEIPVEVVEKKEIIQKKAELANSYFANSTSRKRNKKTVKFEKSVFAGFSLKDAFWPAKFALQFDLSRPMVAFVAVAMIVSLGVGGVSYASKGLSLKGRVLGVSQDGYENLTSAVSDVSKQNFEMSAQKFSLAYDNFSKASDEIGEMGGLLVSVSRYVPVVSKLSSGKNAVEAGKHFAEAGRNLNEVAKAVSGLENPIGDSAEGEISLLAVFQSAEKNIANAKKELEAAQKNIELISVDDLPEDKQEKFALLKNQLPSIIAGLEIVSNNSYIFSDLLGGNGPRKYLFLFQNNSEIRATGGFIGSYGLMDIANGHVRRFFIDGIFNPDGQLRDKIVPPAPIQKISAAWSLHDSNWFPDFPTSAQKAIAFYEKTGGPTADGIISITPTMLQKLLEITGPIAMPEYDVTLDSENFIELTQFKVEVDYDKQENKPKKILSDLAPLVLEKLLSSKDLKNISATVEAFAEGLNEKHILLFSQDVEIQKMISKQGWSGELLPSESDYLSVVNTNINGFKTDAVVTEKIVHNAEIGQDGSIVDTVTITRKHNGGNSEYEWLNKVNADYMRVYVPQGSKLISVSGQTREASKPPLDYDALGFKRDEDVQREETNMVVDEESGTRIYVENGKTVFANWAYVSPQETVTLTYKYQLPFSLFKVAVEKTELSDSYFLVAQKQSGSLGSEFTSTIIYPENYQSKWKFPENNKVENQKIVTETSLKNDRFVGVIFSKDN